MYKPAPYLTHYSSPYQLELLRIRTQHTIHIIPSHLHYAFRNPRAEYQDRVCPYCLASGTWILGDELHIICQCLTTKVVLDRFAVKFQRLTRLLDLPSLTTFSAEETTRFVLGNPPARVLQQKLRRWIQNIPSTSWCWHVSDDDAASSDNHDDFSLILLPSVSSKDFHGSWVDTRAIEEAVTIYCGALSPSSHTEFEGFSTASSATPDLYPQICQKIESEFE